MNIFGIGQNTSIDQISAIQRVKKYNAQMPASQVQGGRISISPEAMEMYRALQRMMLVRESG